MSTLFAMDLLGFHFSFALVRAPPAEVDGYSFSRYHATSCMWPSDRPGVWLPDDLSGLALSPQAMQLPAYAPPVTDRFV